MFQRISLRHRIGFAVALWIVCELIAFSIVVQYIGLGGALLLGIVTSVIGGSRLKQVGTSALDRLRRQAAASGSGFGPKTVGLDGTLAAIGAMLLLLPGFVTDAIGLILSLAMPRAWVTRWVARGTPPNGRTSPQQDRARHGPATIDLAPEDWHPVKD